MKLTKRIVSVLLSAVVLLSALCMVACDDKATPMENINGVEPKEACFVAFAQLVEEERYHVSVDANIMLNALVASIPVGIDGFYDYTLDGSNVHFKFTDKDLLFIDNEKLLSLFKGYDKEVWYVDGVRYSVKSNGEKVMGSNAPSNIVGKIIDTITADIPDDPKCFMEKGEQYILMEITLEEFSAEPMNCRIYLDEEFNVYKADVSGNLYGVDVVLAMNFDYENFAPVTVPANANEFVPAK